MVTAYRSRLLKRSLLAYRKQRHKNTELIVEDDDKGDLAPLLRELPGGIKYLKIEKKAGIERRLKSVFQYNSRLPAEKG